MNDSMWRKIRIASGKTQVQVAKELKMTRQAISRFEKGKAHVPIRMQIYYLKLRNTKEDEIIIKYLEEGMRNERNND